MKGKHCSKDTRQKMSIAHKGHYVSNETRCKISAVLKGRKGTPHSKETRWKMSIVHKGHYVSSETRQKMSIAAKGNTYSLGNRHSEETRQKISAARKGRPLSKEHRRKLSVASKKWWSLLPKWKQQQLTAPGIKSMHLTLESIGLSPSSLERTMHQHFSAAGVAFETQKEFPPYFVDIWIPALNLAVECDGVYWHNLPGARKKEQKRDHYLITRYKICIVRVPEEIIHNDPKQVVSAIVKGKLV